MDVTLVNCTVVSGRLDGFVVGDSGPLALHLHGTWGNFYENPFVAEVAESYLCRGWRYASVNLPSHDGGSVHERLPDSLDAVRAWLDLLCDDGAPLILQGHSLGANKVLGLMHDPAYRDIAARVIGLVLLSPVDMVAFYGGPNSTAVRQARAIATRVARADERATMPPELFDLWPISAGLFLEMTESDGAWDLFPSRTGDGHVRWVAGTERPTLVAIGADDAAMFPSPADIAEGLATIPHASVRLIPRAPHNFSGQEPVLRDSIATFVASLEHAPLTG